MLVFGIAIFTVLCLNWIAAARGDDRRDLAITSFAFRGLNEVGVEVHLAGIAGTHFNRDDYRKALSADLADLGLKIIPPEELAQRMRGPLPLPAIVCLKISEERIGVSPLFFCRLDLTLNDVVESPRSPGLRIHAVTYLYQVSWYSTLADLPRDSMGGMLRLGEDFRAHLEAARQAERLSLQRQQ
jgi:hypothetical protein